MPETPDKVAADMVQNAPKPDATKPAPTVGENPPEVKRKRGRPPGSGNNAAKKQPENSARAQGAAKMLNTIFFAGLGVVGGDELLPSEDEAKYLDNALVAYIETTEFDPPPGFILLALYSGFIANKLKQQDARKSVVTRMVKFRVWFSGKFKRAGQKEEKQ